MKSIVALFVIVAVVYSAPISEPNSNQLVKCRTEEAKAFAQATIQLNNDFVAELKNATAAQRIAIIQKYREIRQHRTERLLKSLREKYCLFSADLVSSTVLPVAESSTAASAPVDAEILFSSDLKSAENASAAEYELVTAAALTSTAAPESTTVLAASTTAASVSASTPEPTAWGAAADTYKWTPQHYTLPSRFRFATTIAAESTTELATTTTPAESTTQSAITTAEPTTELATTAAETTTPVATTAEATTELATTTTAETTTQAATTTAESTTQSATTAAETATGMAATTAAAPEEVAFVIPSSSVGPLSPLYRYTVPLQTTQ